MACVAGRCAHKERPAIFAKRSHAATLRYDPQGARTSGVVPPSLPPLIQVTNRDVATKLRRRDAAMRSRQRAGLSPWPVRRRHKSIDSRRVEAGSLHPVRQAWYA